MKSTRSQEIETKARRLSERGIECVLERFRLPAHPRLTVPAAFLAGSASAFLLGGGHGSAAVLAATAATILLWLNLRGFSPLDWLGRKEPRVIAVVPGSPGVDRQKALFLGIPLLCGPRGVGCAPGAGSIRSGLPAGGLLLCLLLGLGSAGHLMRFWTASPGATAVAGAALFAAAVLQAVSPPPGGTLPNRAAEWIERLPRPDPRGPRPFLFLYSGDPEEVKYFLARHRGDLLRGTGLFLAFPAGEPASPAVSAREGPVLPLRVDPELRREAREAADTAGIRDLRETVLRGKSPGMFAMARGFRAITLLGGGTLPEEAVLGWIGELLDRFHPRGGPAGTAGEGTIPRHDVEAAIDRDGR
ncbi:MAG: hypothetical protein Kow00128_21070 [Deltaproteobacteria bacterium]